MLDSWLVARLAGEAESLLRGARIEAVAATETGLTLHCYRRGGRQDVRVSLDQDSPLLAVLPGDARPKQEAAAGWIASAASLLRGSIIDGFEAVPNDRVMFVAVSSRSAFGVPALTRIVLELQPRKANAAVLRDSVAHEWVVVAAAKQFDAPVREGADSAARSLRVGHAYELPPARRARLDRAQFLVICDRVGVDDRAELLRALGALDPRCTPPLAREIIARVAREPEPMALGRQLLHRWDELLEQVSAAAEADEPLWLYRRGETIVACHVVPLSWPEADAERAPRLNDVCIELLSRRERRTASPEIASLRRRLATMLERGASEAAQLARASQTARDAEAFRLAGETIYAHLTEIPARATAYDPGGGQAPVELDPNLSAKENAARYFKRYRKARSGLPQIERRLQTLAANAEYWQQLLWELERSADASVADDRAQIIDEIRTAAGVKRQTVRRQKPARRTAEIALADGAIAYVGRSPKDNERVTFTLAAPGDLWFHARGIPGAHVILKANGRTPSDRQIVEAAALAAGHSRAGQSAAVEVDYTARKHVRRHPSGRPGLVTYERFQTIRVTPKRV